MIDREMAQIQTESVAAIAHDDFVAIVQRDGRFIVMQHLSSGGTAPQSEYPSARDACARVLQLLRTGPVAPQSHPEVVEIQVS